MTVIFSYPPYFRGTLVSRGSAWVFGMSLSAICGSDADFYKLYITEKIPALWVLWVSTESQASLAGISKYYRKKM